MGGRPSRVGKAFDRARSQVENARPGDWIEIPPHVRHRVEWTETDEPTVWLAIHAKGRAGR